ncbi:MAG: hypothetical protein ACRDT2_11000 [Natronosporangium sp.]
MAVDGGHVKANLDFLRAFARDCCCAGEDVAAVIERSSNGAARMAGAAGGLAEEFRDLCAQGHHRHRDLLDRAAAKLRAHGQRLDGVASRLENTDADSASGISRAASGPDGM